MGPPEGNGLRRGHFAVAALARQPAWTARRAGFLGIALLGTCAAAACRREPPAPAPNLPEGRVEVRDGTGRITLALRRDASGYQVSDGTGRSLGRLTRGPDGLSATEGEIAPVKASAAGDGVSVRLGDGRSLRLQREGDTGFRLGDERGTPLARLRLAAGEITLFNAGGTPLARARAEGGRIVVGDRDGSALGYVTGDVPLERAALVFLPALTVAARAALLASR